MIASEEFVHSEIEPISLFEMPFITVVGETEAEAHPHIQVIADTMPLWSEVHDQTFGPAILLVTATSTEEAIFILQKKQINLVMTDMNFPNLNGLEFVMIIEKETRLPIVLMCDPSDQQLVMDGLTGAAAILGFHWLDATTFNSSDITPAFKG